MPGLLDDYGALLRGRPKIMPGAGMLDPTGPVAMTAGDELDPTMKGRLGEALEVRGAAEPPVPGGTLAGPNQQRAFAAGDQPGAGFGPRPPPGLSVAQADAAPPKINLAEMNFGMGDKGFPMKEPARLAQGLPMTGPEPPSLLSPQSVAGATPRPPTQFAQIAPASPPPRPPNVGGTMIGNPQVAGAGPPQPPPRPAGLTPGGNPALTPPPNPIIPPKIGAPPAMAAASIAPTPPPIAPVAPIAPPPIAPAAGGAAGAAGGAAGGLGGVFSALAGIAKGIGGGAAPAPPPAKAPQIQPMSQDARAGSRAQGAQQAMAGILGGPSLIDPRRRGMV